MKKAEGILKLAVDISSFLFVCLSLVVFKFYPP
jgi:hypothetical protein